LSANEGTLVIVIRSALPLRQSARALTKPPGASISSSVSGSAMGTIPASSTTVATQMEFDPDMDGVSAGSMMM
jgi:hypothetical protein